MQSHLILSHLLRARWYFPILQMRALTLREVNLDKSHTPLQVYPSKFVATKLSLFLAGYAMTLLPSRKLEATAYRSHSPPSLPSSHTTSPHWASGNPEPPAHTHTPNTFSDPTALKQSKSCWRQNNGFQFISKLTFLNPFINQDESII